MPAASDRDAFATAQKKRCFLLSDLLYLDLEPLPTLPAEEAAWPAPPWAPLCTLRWGSAVLK